MPCALTQDYNQAQCADLFGGLSTVYLLEFYNLLDAPVTAGAVTAVTKVSTTFFRKYNLKVSTADADEAMTVSRENNTKMVKQSLRFPMQGLAVTLRNEIELLAKNLLVIVIVDENGMGWMYGRERGMRLLTANAKTGKVLSDFNGYELAFDAEEKELAVSVSPSIIETLQTPGT
jgi:hypothetical protein